MIKILCLIVYLSIYKSQAEGMDEAMQMMKNMNQMMNNMIADEFGDGAIQTVGKGRHVETRVTIGADGSQTTQTIETVNGPSGIPFTTVVVTKKNLKVGGGGPRINPFQLFSGK